MLGIGTTDDVFHASGTLPDFNDRLKRCVTVGVIASVAPFSMYPDTPSGPAAL